MKEDLQYINSIMRAINILEIMAEEGLSMGITDISKRLDLHKSTTFNIVKTLEKCGWLVQNKQTNLYHIGFGPLKVAASALQNNNERDAILHEMETIAQTINEDVVLSAVSSGVGLCIEKCVSNNALVTSSKPGSTVPLHRGATGKILLAFQSEKFIDAVYQDNQDDIPVSRQQFEESLRKIKAQRYSFTSAEFDDGVSAIAVPVMDAGGAFLYGLSVAGPIARIEEKGVSDIVYQLTQAARRITDHIRILSIKL